MNAPARLGFFDGFISLMTGLGVTGRDKGVGGDYTVNFLSEAQLENAYRGNWIARKVVDIPALDGTREWRNWQAENADITKIEDLEKSLRLRTKVRRAWQRGRLYGGACLVIGVDGGSPATELNPEKVRKDQLKFLHVLNRGEIRAGELERSPIDPNYGLPKYYDTHADAEGGGQRIHPSRIVRFEGPEVPALHLSLDGGWGDSILQVVDDAVRAACITTGGIAHLISELKVDVIKIPQLTTQLSNKDYQARLLTRFAFANESKSVINALLLDKEEEWERISASLAGVPDILKMYLLIASGAADIPATRMLGQSPAGMNATGESDIRNYYDMVKSEQTNALQPSVAPVLDEVLIRSALGSRPDDIYYEWAPLWQMTEHEAADLAAKKAQVHKVDVDTGLIDSEALRIARENQLVEDGFYPGLEQALEEAEEMREEGVDDPDLTAAQREFAKANPEPNPIEIEQAKAEARAGVKPKLKVVGDWDPDQPRVPAGDPDGGQWAGGEGGGESLPPDDQGDLEKFASRDLADLWMKKAAKKAKVGQELGLTQGDIAHILAHTGEEQLYRSTNTALRKREVDANTQRFVDRLNEVLGKLPDYRGTVYRNAALGNDIADQYQPGVVVEELAYTSSSRTNLYGEGKEATERLVRSAMDPTKTIKLSTPGDYIFEIESKRGKSIEKVSAVRKEQEVLFRPKTRFRVMGREGARIRLREEDE